MASSFERSTLIQLASPTPNSTAAGPFGSNLVSGDYVERGVPVIRGQNLSERWVGGDFVYVSQEKADRLRTNTAKPGDIVFTQRGTLGQVSLVPAEPYDTYVISQSQMKLTVDESKADPVYVYYAAKSHDFISQIQDNAVAAGVPHINLGLLRAMTIPVPGLHEQRSIASTLSSLDDRIDNLRQANSTLEAIAQALFKSWFVDFDPVRAKAEGREPEGMDAATAALFPSEFEDLEFGPIPKGWMLTKISAVAELIKGCSYKGAGLRESEGAFMFNLGCFNAIRTFATENIKRYTGAYRDRHVVRGGDLIMANTDMTQHRQILGRALFVPTGYDPAFVSHHVFKVVVKRPSADVWKRYLFFAFQQSAFRERAVGHATGTTVLALARDSAELCPVIEPTNRVLASFDGVVAPLLCKIEKNLKLVSALEQLRDTLLPRLISGKLRLSDAETLVDEASV
ncbi:MAG: restriction endonuclease subunit S [Lysobacteraceae bacterium]|nr:MAG: restriction endonuclease subunit S [Xanthomonadaceae bacterium]